MCVGVDLQLYHSEDGDPFYYNITDDCVQWDPPVVLMAGVIPETDSDDEDACTPIKKKAEEKL